MKKIIIYLTVFFVAFCVSSSQADVNPNDLIKLTPQNNPTCIEYYVHQGEIYCNTKAQSTQPVVEAHINNYERQKIAFDDRYWKIGWGKQTPEVTTVEYIPAGDNIENWNELITSQYFPGLQNKIPPRAYMDMMMQELKKQGFDAIFNIIEETSNQLIFEFRITSPKNQAQDELQKITKVNDGLYILHYVIKQGDMGQQNRDKWIANLKKSQISLNQKIHSSR